jgi:hypothetical protein
MLKCTIFMLDKARLNSQREQTIQLGRVEETTSECARVGIFVTLDTSKLAAWLFALPASTHISVH